MSAKVVADAFVRHWIAKYGVPRKLTTDRGAQFISKLFKQLSQILGVHQITTISYDPKANGLIERQHRRLKQALKCQVPEWFFSLPVVLLGMRTVPLEEYGITSAELVYGEKLKLPGEFCTESQDIRDSHGYIFNKFKKFLKRIGQSNLENQINQYSSILSWRSANVYMSVRVDWVREPLELLYESPYEVLRHSKKIVRAVYKRKKGHY